MTDETENAPSPALRRAGRAASARVKPAPRPDPQEQRAAGRDEPGRLKRTRRRVADALAVDPRLRKEGFSYEWKSESVAGQPEPAHMNDLKENHWREVPADRVKGAVVSLKGLRLMERPAYLTEEAKREDYDIAIDQVRGVTDRLRTTPRGQLTREHPSVERISGIKRTYSSPVQDD